MNLVVRVPGGDELFIARAGHSAIETESRDLKTIEKEDDTQDRVSPYRRCRFGMLIWDMSVREPHPARIRFR